MEITTLNLITLFAYAALAVDFLLQIHRVWANKHSGDVSLVGVTVRTTAAAVVLAKIVAVGDAYLLIGQSTMVVLLVVYLALVFRFRNAI